MERARELGHVARSASRTSTAASCRSCSRRRLRSSTR
jgi:hypothetical protein